MVQENALDVLIRLDGMEETKKEAMQVRSALVASGNPEFAPDVTFPEYFGGVKVIEDTGGELPDDVDLDYSDVKWESPADSGFEEYQRLQEVLAGGRHVSVTDGDDEEPGGFVQDPTFDEREWL